MLLQMKLSSAGQVGRLITGSSREKNGVYKLKAWHSFESITSVSFVII